MSMIGFINLFLAGICIGTLLFVKGIGCKIWGLTFGIINTCVGFESVIQG